MASNSAGGPTVEPEHESVALRACPTCGHGIASAELMVCPQCGASLAAIEEAAEAAAPAMGAHAAKGFSFMLAQSLGTRVIALASQILLAHLLLPEHFGLVAMADTVATFANLLQMIGVREILVSRQKRFHLWANAAFWISTTAGWTAAVTVVLAAPLAARMYGNSDLVGILMLIALSIPLYSMGTVAEAKLQADLRFKYLAIVIAVWAALLPLLTVALAAMGFGVYSLVIPRAIVAAIRLAMTMKGARPRIHWNPQFRRWKYIVGTSVLVFFTSLLLLWVQIGDRAILGFFVDEHGVGLYWLAFSFSMQTIMMVSINLEGILFATLAKLNDEPARQLRAFLRASRVLASVVVPICLIQAAASEALVRTVFSYNKWHDSVPAMQALGFGMLFMGSYCPATAMLMAQRRFKTRFRMAVVHALVYGLLVGAGVAIGVHFGGSPGGVAGAAIGVAATLAITSPIWSQLATSPMGGTWGQTLGIVARPLMAGGIAVALGLGAAMLAGRAAAGVAVHGVGIEHWLRLTVICGISGLAYVPLARLFMPEEYREIGSKALAILRRVSPGWAERTGRLLGV